MSDFIRLWPYLAPYRRAAALAPLCMMGAVLMDLALPAIMQRMIDVGVAAGDLPYITRMGFLLLGAALLEMVSSLTATYFACQASQNLGADLRQAVFARVLSLSAGNVDRLETGEVITRATNDIEQIQNTTLMGLRIAVRAPFLLAGGLLMAYLTSPGLSVILLGMLPVLLVAILFIVKLAFPMFARVQSRIDRVNGVIQENLAGIREVRAFVRQDAERERFDRASRDLRDTAIQAYSRIAMMMPVIMVVINGGVVAALYLGGVEFAGGRASIGQIQAFINYLMLILFSLLMMAMVLMMLSRGEASARRIREILTQEPAVRDRPGCRRLEALRGRVEFADVSFSYTGQPSDAVLREISFTVEPGETLAILGSTGSGKTTLVHLLSRFYDVTGGRILLDGVDIRDICQEDLRGGVGIVPQDPRLFGGTIRENLLFSGRSVSSGTLEEAVRQAAADGFIREKGGYDAPLGSRGVNLSGGQKQRLAIARTLLADPRVLILDDALSAVDVVTGRAIEEGIRRAMRGRTVIKVAQRIHSVLDADRILVLEDGRIQAQGDHRTLLAESPLYREICASQLGGTP